MQKCHQNFLISANSFVQRAGYPRHPPGHLEELALQALQVRGRGCVALPKEGDKAVARMRAVNDKRRKLMVELMREVGFGIPVMPQGALYVFADASRWTDDSYQFAFEILERAGARGGRGRSPGGVPRGAPRHPRNGGTSHGERLRRRRRALPGEALDGGGGQRIGAESREIPEEERRILERLPRVEILDVSLGSEERGFDIGGHHYWYEHPWVSSDVILSLRTDLALPERALAPRGLSQRMTRRGGASRMRRGGYALNPLRLHDVEMNVAGWCRD